MPKKVIGNHKLEFSVPPDRWQDAFPVGNGLLGATVYQPGDSWEWVINQMDVVTSYHHITDQQDMDAASMPIEAVERLAIQAHSDPSNPAYQDYNNLFGAYQTTGERKYKGRHDPLCGKLRFTIDRTGNRPISHAQRLDLAGAYIEIEEIYTNGNIRCESFVSKDSQCLIIRIFKHGLCPSVSAMNIFPDMTYPVETITEDKTSLLKGSPTDTFSYIMGVRVISPAQLKWTDNVLNFDLSDDDIEILLAVAVSTSLDVGDPSKNVNRILDSAEETGYLEIMSRHLYEWEKFWAKSSIQLPDKFLEYLWYFHLYSLASTSGIGAKDPQGCGIYGLWYNSPSRWPNRWYDDVNIQEAYWPVYVSNHLELSVPFIDGVKARLPIAKQQANNWYGKDGAAFGYYLMPCIGPWYCQYLWRHYKYSGDTDFLRESAYPIFKEVLSFFESYLKCDESGKLSIFPSISPEQGPVTKNDTITISCLKYLLGVAIESMRILGVDENQAELWKDMLSKLPGFPTGRSDNYGDILLDSEWATPELFLAHAGVLMPIFPLHQIGNSKIAQNTIRYVENNISLCTHSSGWIAAAAAALGLGDEAVRILYDKLLSLMMVPTGFIVENTDRKVEACSTMFPSCYSPAIMEGGGSIVATINEMLIQSTPAGISVFPSLPTTWKEAAFANLLTEGGFEVSANINEGIIEYIVIKSLAGGKCKLLNPWIKQAVKILGSHNEIIIPVGKALIEFDTDKGAIFWLKPVKSVYVQTKANTVPEMPYSYRSPYKFKLFLGRNETSGFLEKLDRFLFNTRLGNFEIPRSTRYKFDFGNPLLEKDYDAVVPIQFMPHNKFGFDFQRVGKTTMLDYNQLYGFGWVKENEIIEVIRDNSDTLRCDFISGTQPVEFQVLLIKGSYQALIVTGDDKDVKGHAFITMPDGHTWESSPNFETPGFDVSVVSFEALRDGLSSFNISSSYGHAWKISMLLVNQVY